MKVPHPPEPTPFTQISPSLYEALIACPSRATWIAFGDRRTVASHPSALLGVCFHHVMECIQKGEVSGTQDERHEKARTLFDRHAAKAHANAHPLLKVKFPAPERLPYYNFFRERAATLARVNGSDSLQPAEGTDGSQHQVSEERFVSSDGLIVGRPDLVDGEAVVDYKSGVAPEQEWVVTEREGRQLRLYAYLARQAGFEVTQGMIIRGNGATASIDISSAAAKAEAGQARELLAQYNSVAPSSAFGDYARPAADTCRSCPCMPMCEAFWRESSPAWQQECGVHIEGKVVRVERATVLTTPLISLEVQVSRGTLPSGSVVVEQIPLVWLTADGDRAPLEGDVVRCVDLRSISSDEPVVVRADRISTAVWRVVPEVTVR